MDTTVVGCNLEIPTISGKSGLCSGLICYYICMRFLIFTILLFVIPVSFLNAQVGLDIGNQEVSIDLEPAYPEPENTFTASLNDYSLAAEVTSITWKVDGVAIPDSKNQRTISVKAKSAGVRMQIEATITISGGGTRVVKQTVTPLYFDVVVEAQTKTPTFYKGRSLPSIGSIVNLTALISGDNTLPSALLYTWRVNNQVVEGGTVRGKNTISIQTPPGQTFLISVDVSSLDGKFLARRTLELPSVSPEILFYETSSLYGVSHTALSSFNLVGNSATLKAEPYNLDIRTYNNPDHLEWKVDGVLSNNTGGNPYEITIARPDGESLGTSRINLHVRSLTKLLQGSRGDLTINF
jgi:hypothetical protein